MFKCVLYVFVTVKCLITTVVICVVVLVFRLLSDSVIIIIVTLIMKPPAVSLNSKQKATWLMGLHNKTGNSSVNVSYSQSRHPFTSNVLFE